MNFKQYITHFESVMSSQEVLPPYDNPDYMDYTKLNWSRMNRWLKNGKINEALKQAIQSLDEPQDWVLITEPWCGDAAHIVPFIALLSGLNEKITLEIQLRDTDSEIENYLTRGGKSIPKLIIRDTSGDDKVVWGPRPEPCHRVFEAQVAANADHDTLVLALQKWYNQDKGATLQQELLSLLSKL